MNKADGDFLEWMYRTEGFNRGEFSVKASDFLSRCIYTYEQFEVIGSGSSDAPEALGIQPMGDAWLRAYRAHGGTGNYTSGMRCLAIITEDGRGIAVYKRILVRNKHLIAQ